MVARARGRAAADRPRTRDRVRGLQPARPRLSSGAIRKPEDLDESDFRRENPRFQGENFDKNLELVDRVEEISSDKGVKPGQLALAWVLAQGEDVVPIPGTKRRSYLEETRPPRRCS